MRRTNLFRNGRKATALILSAAMSMCFSACSKSDNAESTAESVDALIGTSDNNIGLISSSNDLVMAQDTSETQEETTRHARQTREAVSEEESLEEESDSTEGKSQKPEVTPTEEEATEEEATEEEETEREEGEEEPTIRQESTQGNTQATTAQATTAATQAATTQATTTATTVAITQATTAATTAATLAATAAATTVVTTAATTAAATTAATTATTTTAAATTEEETCVFSTISDEEAAYSISEECCYKMCRASFDGQNEYRVENGVEPLIWSDELYQMAVQCAKACAEGGAMDHALTEEARKIYPSSPLSDGCDIVYSASENLGNYVGTGDDWLQWTNDEGHRANMLRSDVTYGAIGTWIDSSGSVSSSGYLSALYW